MKLNRKAAFCAVVLAAAVLLAGTGVRAETIDNIVKQAEARQKKFFDGIKDMTLVQDSVTNTPQGQINGSMTMMMKGKKYRMTSSMDMPGGGQGQMPGKMETVAVYDGKEAWMVTPFTGKQKLPPDQIEQMDAANVWWTKALDGATLAGSETVDGHDCWVIEAAPAKAGEPGEHGRFTKLWLDKKSLNQVRAEAEGPQGRPVVMKFSDFRDLKPGYEIPYKTQSYIGDQMVSEMTVKSVEIDKGLADDLFDPNQLQAPVGPSMEDMMKMMQKQTPPAGMQQVAPKQ